MEAVKSSLINTFDRQSIKLQQIMQLINGFITNMIWFISDWYDDFALVTVIRLRAFFLRVRRAAPMIAGITAIFVLTIVPASAIYQLSLYASSGEVYIPFSSTVSADLTFDDSRLTHVAEVIRTQTIPVLYSVEAAEVSDMDTLSSNPTEIIPAVIIEEEDSGHAEVIEELPVIPADPTVSTGVFIWPSEGKVVSGFGPRNIGIGSRNHKGIDIDSPNKAPIYAADGGEVIESRFSESFGHFIRILHDNGYVTLYAHCSSRLVNIGERVAQGDKIALVGMTGTASGYHLHFELIIDGKHVNPIPYLPADIPDKESGEEFEESGFEETRFLFIH